MTEEKATGRIVRTVRERTRKAGKKARLYYRWSIEKQDTEDGEKEVNHITVVFREGEYRTKACINAFSDSRKKTGQFFLTLVRNRVTPLSLAYVYEDMLTP